MTRSYIAKSHSGEDTESYYRYKSYIENNAVEKSTTKYVLVPEEYAIFSEVDVSQLSTQNIEQQKLLTAVIQCLKTKLLGIYVKHGILRILPKIKASIDEDNAIILHWAYSSFRVSLCFETESENSYYGIVAQNEDEAIFSQSGRLNADNYGKIVDVILSYVMNNV